MSDSIGAALLVLSYLLFSIALMWVVNYYTGGVWSFLVGMAMGISGFVAIGVVETDTKRRSVDEVAQAVERAIRDTRQDSLDKLVLAIMEKHGLLDSDGQYVGGGDE